MKYVKKNIIEPLNINDSKKFLIVGIFCLTALFSLVFAQPIFNLLGANPSFFVSQKSSAQQIIFFACSVVILPGLIIAVVETVVFLINKRAYQLIHFLLTALIVSGFAIRFFSDKDWAVPVIFIVSLITGTIISWAIYRFLFLKNLTEFLIPVPLILVAIFLFFSDTGKTLILSDKEEAEVALNGEKIPIFLIVFDELRLQTLLNSEGDIDQTRFPNFYDLKHKSSWYPNYMTSGYFTTQVLPTMLSGVKSKNEKSASFHTTPDNLFSFVDKAGYTVQANEPVAYLCKPDICPIPDSPNFSNLINKSFSLWKDYSLPEGLQDNKVGGIDDFNLDSQGKNKNITKVENLFNPRPETFHFQHFLTPHQPWNIDEAGSRLGDNIIEVTEGPGKKWTIDQNGIDFVFKKHILATAFADNLLGQALEKIKQSGLYDESLIVVASDHGVSFQGGEVAQRDPQVESFGEVVNTVLFMKTPYQTTGIINPEIIETVDIAPTILRYAGIETTFQMEGTAIDDTTYDPSVKNITVTNREGQDFSVSSDEIIQQSAWANFIFHERFKGSNLYDYSSYPDLIGQSISNFTFSQNTPIQGKIQHKTNKIIVGELDDSYPGETILMTLDNRIISTSQTFNYQDKTIFADVINHHVQNTALKLFVLEDNEITPVSFSS